MFTSSFLFFTVAIVGLIAPRAVGREMWLNELNYENEATGNRRAEIEVVLRPDDDDLATIRAALELEDDDPLVAAMEVEWYEADSTSTGNLKKIESGVYPNRAAVGSKGGLWNGNWVGTLSTVDVNVKGAFPSSGDAQLGGVRITPIFKDGGDSNEAGVLYCWGEGATVGTGVDDESITCDEVVSNDITDVTSHYAMVDGDSPPGEKGGDFKWVPFGGKTIGEVNNCEGDSCGEGMVQTLAVYSFAASIFESSFAVVMGASLATLFTVSIGMA